MKHAENESSIGQSRSAKYRQLKRMGEDVQTSDYMKKKMRQSEDDQIVDLDIEKIMIENPLMSNKEIVGNLQVIRKRLGKAAFHTNVRKAMKRRRNILAEYHETEFRTFEDDERGEVERPLTFINDLNAFIAAICEKRDHSEENLTIALIAQNHNNQLTNLEILCRSVSEEHVLFIDHLRNINFLHTLVNSHTLQLETIRSVIKQMRKTFLKLHTLFGLNESLKLHVIFAHYVEYFEKTGHTLLRYTDEVTEAVHSQLRMFEERHKFKRNDKSSQGHADAQHKCVVFYNSVALGDI